MKLKIVFIAHALAEVVFGLGFLLAPNVLFGLLGTSTDATGIVLSRIAGAVILSLAIISWFGRDVPTGTLRDAMVWSFVLAHSAAGIVVALAVWDGTFNWLGWPAAGLDAFFVLMFVWLHQQG